MSPSLTPNCEEFYIKAHSQHQKDMCTSTTFYIISEMLSRVYGKRTYKISIDKFNKIFNYHMATGVVIDSLKFKFDTSYTGGLEIKEIRDSLMENSMPKIYENYVLKCITYPIINIDLTEVYKLVNSGHLQWNVTLNYAYLSLSNRIENHAVILIKYDKKSNIVYLYDPMDISIESGTHISYTKNLQILQKVSVNEFLDIWRYNPYGSLKKLSEDVRKKLISRLVWLLLPKKVSMARKGGKTQKQMELFEFR